MNLEELQRAIRVYGKQISLAHDTGLSVSYVSAVYTGKKPPSKRLLDAIGWEKQVTYRPKPNLN